MLNRALALSILLAGPAFADDVTTFSLENGLDVVVIEDHRAPVVTQMVWYRVGSADEAPGKSGIAHFFEHLMFKGTEKVPPGQFSEIIQSQGGADNAFTYFDYTAYFQRVAIDRLDLVMEMESDRMRNLRLLEDDVITERNVVLEERRSRVDSSPVALLAEQMGAAQYLNYPYGSPVIGWTHELAALDRQDALDFYELYYAPNNAILVVAGDVDPDAVKTMAEKYYGPLEPSVDIPERVRPTEPEQLAERRMVVRNAQAREISIRRSYLTAARKTGDQKEAAALTIFAEMLGGSDTISLFAKGLQFGEAPLASSSWAVYDGNRVGDGMLTMGTEPIFGVSADILESAMDDIINKFLETGPDLADFERIKNQMRTAEIYQRDSADGRANRYGEALAIGLSISDVQEWNAVLASVTPEDVLAAATKALNRNNSVTGYLLPIEKEAAQ